MLETHKFQLEYSETGSAWEASTSEFLFSASDTSACVMIARMLLIQRLRESRSGGQALGLRLPYAKVKPLFKLTNKVSQILHGYQSFTDGKKFDLELNSCVERTNGTCTDPSLLLLPPRR
jgi:hypothetical protein